MNKNIAKKFAAFVLAVIVTGVAFAAQSPVKAAGGESPYITPGETSYNIDFLGLVGGTFYLFGIVLVGYGRIMKYLLNSPISS